MAKKKSETFTLEIVKSLLVVAIVLSFRNKKSTKPPLS